MLDKRGLWTGCILLSVGAPAIRAQTKTVESSSLDVLDRTSILEESPIDWESISWGGGRFHLPLRGLSPEFGRHELLVASGDAWDSAAADLKMEGTQEVVSIATDRAYVLRSKESEEINLGSDKKYLGAQLLYCDGSTRDGSGWTPFVRVRRTPATWQGDAYTTDLVVGLDPVNPEDPLGPLPVPIVIQFFTTGAHVELESNILTINASGPPGYQSTEVRCTNHSASPSILAQLGPFGSPQCSFEIQPSLGKLTLETRSSSILGFGLETTLFQIRRLAEDGTEWAPDQQLEVNLTGAGLFPSVVTIPPKAASAQATVRSRGTGEFEFFASSPLRSDVVRLRFEWPVSLILLSLTLGGGGGFLREWQTRRRSRSKAAKTSIASSRFWKPVVTGCIAGLFAVAATAIGLRTAGVSSELVLTEAGTILIAGLAGYSGSWILTTLSAAIGVGPALKAKT